MRKKLSSLLLFGAVTVLQFGLVAAAGGGTEQKLLKLIYQGHFSTLDGKLILYRGIGSTDSEMGRQHETDPSKREMGKWLDPGGLAAGMAADDDNEAKSFTVSLAYAGRYTGALAWDKYRGVIRIEVPLKVLHALSVVTGRPDALPANTWALLYDTPGSVGATGKDVFDGLPFMGTTFTDRDGTVGTICPPADWENGNCPALEARLSIGTLKKLGARVSVRRVTWAEYDEARRALIDEKDSIMRRMGAADAARVKKAVNLWNAESAFYSSLCGAGPAICPDEPADKKDLCNRLLALPKNHYLFRLPAGSAPNSMLMELVRTRTGPVFSGGTMADVMEECR